MTSAGHAGPLRARRARLLVGLPVAAALLLAACSSSSSSSSSAKGSAAAASAGTPATGSPILIGNISSVTTPIINPQDLIASTKAWIAKFNAEGGVYGHPIKLVTCDDQASAALSIQCANNLIQQGVIGLVNPWSIVFGASALPTVAKAGLPILGGWPVTPQEFSSPVEFPVVAGAAGNYPALALVLRAKGTTRLTGIFENTPAAAGTSNQVKQMWPQVGGTSYAPTYIDPASTDYTPSAAAVVSSRANGAILGMASTQTVRMLTSLGIAGYKGRLAATGLVDTPQVEQQAGSAMNGTYLQFLGVETPPSSGVYASQFKAYAALMKANGLPIDDQTVAGTAGANFLYDVLKSIPKGTPYTASALLKAAQANESWPGYLTHSMSPSYAPAGYPAIRNPYMTVYQYVGNGKIASIQLPQGSYSRYLSTENGVTFVAGLPPASGGSSSGS